MNNLVSLIKAFDVAKVRCAFQAFSDALDFIRFDSLSPLTALFLDRHFTVSSRLFRVRN